MERFACVTKLFIKRIINLRAMRILIVWWRKCFQLVSHRKSHCITFIWIRSLWLHRINYRILRVWYWLHQVRYWTLTTNFTLKFMKKQKKSILLLRPFRSNCLWAWTIYLQIKMIQINKFINTKRKELYCNKVAAMVSILKLLNMTGNKSQTFRNMSNKLSKIRSI